MIYATLSMITSIYCEEKLQQAHKVHRMTEVPEGQVPGGRYTV